MDLLGTVTAPLRTVLGTLERDAEHAMPVHQIEQIQERVLETGEAIRKATESIEAHVAVLETLASSVPALTQAVAQLTAQLAGITEVLRPVAAVEGDVAKLGHLFGRRHRDEPPAGGS